MHDEILTPNQERLLPLVAKFASNFGLVGGTAIALQLGHRRSIDFDLFSLEDFDIQKIKRSIRANYKITGVLTELVNQLTLTVDNIRFTFYKYPFQISFSKRFDSVIKIPDLLTLAAMKAFALGGRAKWKDYVDLYFIFKQLSFREIANKAMDLFENEFNEKLFREQLSYFKDINYSEEIEYMPGFEIEEAKIKKFLLDVSLQKD